MNSVHVISVQSLEHRESIPVIELTTYYPICKLYIPTDTNHFIESENATEEHAVPTLYLINYQTKTTFQSQN